MLNVWTELEFWGLRLPISTNTPTGSDFTFLDTQSPSYRKRFFRGVLLDFLFNGLSISVNATNHLAVLSVQGAQPGDTLILQAPDDLAYRTSLATNSPTAVTNWNFPDGNSPGLSKRFYRVVKQ